MEKKHETMLIVVVAFIVGLLVGVIGSKVGQGPSAPRSQAPSVPAAPQVNYQQQIQQLEQIVKQDPENRNAWVQLGHNYFDNNQPAKAIDAYDQALALDANDPDVLTDQGVMFRRMGWYDKAIDNFSKAAEINPMHATSLFNLGVVYRYDLQEFDKAKEVWTRFLEVAPPGPQADQVRADLEFLQTHPPIPQQ